MLRPDSPLRPSNVTLKLLLDVCIRAGDVDRACFAYDNAQALGLKVDVRRARVETNPNPNPNPNPNLNPYPNPNPTSNPNPALRPAVA